MRPYDRSRHLIVCTVFFAFLTASARAEPPSLGGATQQGAGVKGLPIDEEKAPPVHVTQPGTFSSPVVEGPILPSVAIPPDPSFWREGKFDYTWLSGTPGRAYRFTMSRRARPWPCLWEGSWLP